MKNPAKEDCFERLCREIAEIDHEIVFNELDGVKVSGTKIKTKTKEDIEYRLRCFLS